MYKERYYLKSMYSLKLIKNEINLKKKIFTQKHFQKVSSPPY